MGTVGTVFVKEFLDTIRDRRTIMFMIILPLVLFPVLFKIMFNVQRSQQEKAEAKTLRVACVVENGNATRLIDLIREKSDFTLVAGVEKDSLTSFIRSGQLDGAFVVSDDFNRDVAALKPGRVDFYYKNVDDQRIVRGRLLDVIDEFEEEVLQARFEKLDLDRHIVEGIELRRHNVASMKEKVGKEVGGFLPYIFILFCFMGAMYPAIDLGAGEKERGTLETLLTAPVNRFHILLGKFCVVVSAGIFTAIISIAGLYLGFKQVGELPQDILDVIVKILGADTIGLILSLLFPLTIFFSGILLSISLTAKSFKEAQSLITPLNMAIIVPAAIGLLPGVEMNFKTALIPVLNVSLATKEIIAGTMDPAHLAVVYVSLILLAVLSLYGASQWFRRESVIFRT